MSMDCRETELQELLPGYAHGRLAGEERALVSAHVAGCAACARELEIIDAARAAYSRVRVPGAARIVAALPAPPSRAGPLVARGGAPAGAARRAWPGRVSAFRIAAGIAAIAVGGAGLRIATENGPAAGRAPAPAVVAQSPDTSAPEREPHQPDTVANAAPRAQRAGGARGSTVAPRAIQIPARGMTFGGGVSDLSDADLRALLADIDDIDAVPAAEPESETSAIGIGEG